jgi:predicted ribonuclease YlaK
MIQGYSIHNSIVIVDESQFLSLDLIKQIVSRISEGSKLIMLYDEKQSYGIADYIGLKKILESLPNPLFSYVRLKNIYRSKYADYAEKL